MNLSPADRLRIRWRLALDGLEVQNSTSFRGTGPTGRCYTVGVPDSGPLAVVCTYEPSQIVWVGSLSRPQVLVMWDGDYKSEGDVWFDETEFRATAKAAEAWTNEDRPGAGFVSLPGVRA
jgi:hypothetical protein